MNQHPPPPYPQYPAPQQPVSFAYPTPPYHQAAAQQTPYAYPSAVPPTSQQQQQAAPPTSQQHHHQPQPPLNPPPQPQLQPPNPFFQALPRQQHAPSLPRPSPTLHQSQAPEPGPPPPPPPPPPPSQSAPSHQPQQQQRGVIQRPAPQVSRPSQQSVHDGSRSIPSTPGHGPGAPPPERNSPDATYERDLMSALRQDDDNDDQSDPPGDEDKDEPIYQIPAPPEEIYPNADELEKALHAWSLEHGYELVRRASKKNARGVLYKRYFHCSKHGKTANTSKLNDKNRVRINRKSNRIGCPMSLAAVAVNPHEPSGDWQIRHRKSHHNHPPVDAVQLAGHRRRARMGGVEKAVDGLFLINTSTADVLKFLQRTNPDGLFTRTDVANMKLKWKKYGTCTHHGEETTSVEKPPGPPPKIGVASACLSCRSKKTKCDSARPVCGQCSRTGVNCQYDHEPQAIAPPPPPPTQPPQPQAKPQPAPDGGPRLADDNDTAMIIDEVPPASAGNTFPPLQTTPASDRRSIAQTEQILAQLASFQQEHVRPTKLYLESSTVETLAHSSCGNGDSYKNLPTLTSIANWPAFRDAFTEACLKENTHDVLVGLKKEPLKPVNDGVPVEEWNEYIKQLAIFNRRNSALLGALWGSLAPNLRSRVSNMHNAHDVWLTLEDLCAPRGSDQAFYRFSDLHNITLRDSGGVLENYTHRLETAFHDFNQLAAGHESRRPHAALMQSYSEVHKRNRGGNGTLPEEMLCFLFLKNLGPEYRQFVENLCKKNNIAGFGSGERLGFKELTALVRHMLE